MELLCHLFSQLFCQDHAILRGHSGDGNEWNHVGCPHAGMFTFMLIHIDQLGGFRDGFESGKLSLIRTAHKGDHGPIMIRIHLLVQKHHPRHRFDLIGDRLDYLWSSSFGEIGNTFYNLCHFLSS